MRFPIRMRYARDYRDNIEELKSLIIPVGNSGRVSSVESMYSAGPGDLIRAVLWGGKFIDGKHRRRFGNVRDGWIYGRWNEREWCWRW